MSRSITIKWHLDDVQAVRPDLTDKQAREVFELVRNRYDADVGVTWDVIRVRADELFPENKKSWVVVTRYGRTNEKIVAECATYDDAWTAYHELFSAQERAELDVDIVKRLPNGDLTTEY